MWSNKIIFFVSFRAKAGYKTASVMSAVDQDSSTNASLVTTSIIKGDPLHYFDVIFQSKHSLEASGMYLNIGFEVRICLCLNLNALYYKVL